MRRRQSPAQSHSTCLTLASSTRRAEALHIILIFSVQLLHMVYERFLFLSFTTLWSVAIAIAEGIFVKVRESWLATLLVCSVSPRAFAWLPAMLWSPENDKMVLHGLEHVPTSAHALW